MAYTMNKLPAAKTVLPVTGRTLAGKKFILTGTMKAGTRSQVEANIIALGGSIISLRHIYRNPDIFVVAAPDGVGSDKYRKAESEDAQIIDEMALEHLMKYGTL